MLQMLLCFLFDIKQSRVVGECGAIATRIEQATTRKTNGGSDLICSGVCARASAVV